MRKAASALMKLVRDCRGLASVEAAFFAPIFVLGALAVFDLGLAGTKRMELDQALRAGAQLSMINVNDESQIMNAALAALGEQSGGSVLEDGICQPNASCVTVNYACECADGTPHACDSLCTAGDIPSAYLTIEASRRHEGLLFPDMNLNTQIMVQTR